MSKQKKRKIYHKNAIPNKYKKTGFAPGIKGFICTCNNNIKTCIREAFCVLDEYHTKLNVTEEKVQSENTIENDLFEELKETKNETKVFQVVDTGINNCVFIKTTLDDPCKLGMAIMEDLQSTKIHKTKVLLRLVPVAVTCKAYVADIVKAAEELFNVHFTGEATTFSIVINKRCNNNVDREELISALAQLVKNKNKDHKVDLKNSKNTIVLEILKGVCGISVLEKFFEYRKYNLIEICKPDTSQVVD